MLTAAEWGYKGHVEGAQIAADASKYGHDKGLEGTEATAGASMYGADKRLEGEQYGADKRLEGDITPKEYFSYSLSRAAGGPVKGKRPYLVGERGPELMVPKQSGTIIPNHNLREIARAVPRADGGDVQAGGAGGMYGRVQARREAASASFKDAAASKLIAQKDLLRATADIDPTGQRTVNLANAATIGAAADKADIGDEQGTYKRNFTLEHGAPNPGEGNSDGLNRIYHQGHNMVQAGTHTAAEATQAIQPDIQKHYYTPENVDRALNAISQRTGQPITPAWRANAMSGTPEAMGIFVPEIQKTLRQPKPGFWGSAAKNVTTPANPFDAGQ